MDMSHKHIYNLRPTPLSHEFHFSKLMVAPPSTTPLPSKMDLRDGGLLDSVYNQGHIGSCTGNGFAAAFNYDLKLQGLTSLIPNPSRLFIYYNERDLIGMTNQDCGSSLGDGIATLQKYGVCSETTWGYDEAKYTTKPINEAYTEASSSTLLQFNSVNTLDDIKQSLANKHPVIVGFTLYPSFESRDVAETGIIPMPTLDESPIGGHCVLIVGYDDEKQWLIVRNSWGESWGDAGYFYVPYTYLPKNLMEAYTLQTVK